jgi:ribulose-5-phosphate 4-epimerase/fuculose-1-phosphate aldolase
MRRDRRKTALDLTVWVVLVTGGTLAAAVVVHTALEHAAQIWTVILLATL